MRFGLFVNTERPSRTPREAMEEDLWEIVAADQLGFAEAWVSEHHWPAEFVIAQAAKLTKTIRLGSGVRPLAFYHPLQVALEANLNDQLTNGRYMLGFGVGGPGGGAERMRQFGLGEDSLRRPRTLEAIDIIMQAFTAERAFDYTGQFWSGRGITLPIGPVQRPHVPVAVANAASMGTSELAGRMGFISLRSQFDEPTHLRELTVKYCQAAEVAGREPRLDEIRASRFVWVSHSTKDAKEELRPTITAAIERRKQLAPDNFAALVRSGQEVGDLTWDDIVDSGHYFVGDADRVCELIHHHYDESGGYGVLLLVCGKDFGTRESRLRSMRLFIEGVAPELAELTPQGPFTIA